MLRKIRKSKIVKVIAVFTTLQFLIQIISPNYSFALTSGPNSPDFSSFEPVATTDMVDPFSGDFTYNIPVLNVPGPDGAGYSMSLSYHSGLSQETEASWVGVGWSLNPGAINRGTKGFPDDYKDETITQYNKVKPNISCNSSRSIKLELYSKDKDKEKKKFGASLMEDELEGDNVSLSYNSGIRYYNYGGLLRTNSYGLSASKEHGSSGGLTVSQSGREVTFSAYFVPGVMTEKLNKFFDKIKMYSPVQNAQCHKSFLKGILVSLIKSLRDNSIKNFKKAVSTFNLGGNSKYGLFSYSGYQFNVSQPRFVARTWKRDYNLQIDVAPINVGIQIGSGSDLSLKVNVPKLDMKAYGYMYNPDLAIVEDPSNIIECSEDNSWNSTVLSDFYLEKSHPYQKRQEFIGIPFNNADNFIVTGENIGGGFKLFHKNVGHYYPNFLENREKIRPMGIELGFGTGIITVGLNFGFGPHKTTTQNWNCPADADEQYNINDLGIFRFNGDLGGKVIYSDNISAEAFKVKAKGLLPGTKSACLKETGLVFNYDYIMEYFNDLNIDDIDNLSELPTGFDPTKAFMEDFISIEDIYEYDEIGRSSYINYKLNSDINHYLDIYNPSDPYANFDYDNYISGNIEERNNDILDFTTVPRNNSDLDERIGEIATYNQDGQRYVYGLPVYTKNEKSLQFKDPKDNNLADIENIIKYTSNVTTQDDNNISNGDELLMNNEIIVGDVKNQPYASTYLLTQITGPNYIDIENNGPDNSDFGSWVKFNYSKTFGYNKSEWFKYRIPYNGFYSDKGTISDKEDDMLSYMEGEREVYNLEYIETKTHVAFFITNSTDGNDLKTKFPDISDVDYLSGSGDLRQDAIGINYSNPSTHNGDPNSKGGDDQKLVKLEKIVLFSKKDFSKPIQTTHFEYDYHLMPGTPNTDDNSGTTGKLTLKRLWFEYEGVSSSRIAPYEFKYFYKKSADFLTSNIITKYPEIVQYGDQFNGFENENYSFGLDCWGNYQSDETRKSKLQAWMSQKDESNFDPATWHLKQIVLPSGGEILIQYEQKDYCYVQDRPAMAMVSLVDNEHNGESYDYEDSKYYLNLEDLGIDPSETAKINSLRDKIYQYYVVNPPNSAEPNESEVNGHIYFKFLYALIGQDLPAADYEALDMTKAEYISGYAYVRDVTVESGTVCIYLGDKGKYYKKKESIPRRICLEYLTNNRGGRVETNDGRIYKISNLEDDIVNEINNGIINGTVDEVGNMVNNAGEVKKKSRKLLMHMANPFDGGEDGNPFTSTFKNYDKDDVCKDIKYNLSYFRVPIAQDKKGGGVRVKRLLLYDKGIENGDETLIGSEYTYKTEDGRSSGVATNEPVDIREENPLVDVIHGKKQKFLSRFISGKQIDELEGPIGESILPSPMIGHSRVVVKNIHTGKTGTGYTVHEFYTCKDWPYDKNYDELKNFSSEIEGKGVEYTKLKDNRKTDWMNLPLGVLNYSANKVWAAQGFRFIKHNMHGLPKRTATYADDIINIGNVPATFTNYNYYNPGEEVNIISYNNTSQKYVVEKDIPGKEMDVCMEMSEIKDRMCDIHLETDIEFAIATPFRIGIGIGLALNFDQTLIATHATTKVINYPVLLKSVESYVDGAYSKTENLAFNKDNGEVLLTKSYDSHDFDIDYYLSKGYLIGDIPSNALMHNGAVYSWNIPGSMMYPELGQIARDLTNNNLLNVSIGNVVSYGENGNPLDCIQSEDFSNFNKSILSSSAILLDKNWYDLTLHPEMSDILDEYNLTALDPTTYIGKSLNDKYNVHSNYVFKNSRTSTDREKNVNNRNYLGGLIENYLMFNWIDTSINRNNGWIYTNGITKYSPNGQALEEKNLMNIYSTVKFGYGDMLPIIVASNAKYENVIFEDFEYTSSTANNIAHSGNNSLHYNSNPYYKFAGTGSNKLVLDQHIKDIGAVVRMWVKSVNNLNPLTVNTNPAFNLIVNTNQVSVPFKKIAQNGEWSLYECKITNWGNLNTNDQLDLTFAYTIVSGEDVYFDDIRFQPADAQMTCYVYDVLNFRLITQFNDQHFGIFYQYNSEGKLVRKIIETEKGMKTISETQYNIPKVIL